MALTILSVVFLALLVLGVPVAFAIGLSAVVTILYEGLPVAVVFGRMVSGMTVFSFLAIPFFIFAGELMLYGGIAHRIVALAKNLVGHVRGGLGMSNVVACTLFGGVSGSPVADVSAMGAVMIPMMKKEGYDADYAVNVDHARRAGRRADADQPQHDHLFAGGGRQGVDRGADPGRAAAGAGADHLQPGRRLRGRDQARLPRRHVPGLGHRRALARRRAPGLFVAVIIVAGILSGVFTATESASVAVLYALLITVLVYRSLSWDDFLKAAARAVKKTGVVLLLIGVSATLGYLMSLYSVAEVTGAALSSITQHAVGDLPAGQHHPVPAGHLPRHGGDDPHLHADLPADLHAVRHGPGAVRHGDADQLRAGPQHAAGGDHAVRGLRASARSRSSR